MVLLVMTNQAYKHVAAIPLITSFPALMLDSDPGMFDTTTNAPAAVPNVPAFYHSAARPQTILDSR